MTESRAFRRRFRGSGSDRVPEGLQRWFAGEVESCWEMLLPYERELLGPRWRAWKAEHPQAVPPGGWQWLDDETDERHATAEEIRVARKMLARDR